MNIQIIEATEQDREALNVVAFASKSSWGYPKHYLEIWHDEIVVQIDLIKDHRIFKAIDDQEEILGFYGLKGDPPKLILEGFWVKPEEMGKGIGRKLFQHMVKTARSLRAQHIEWESDPNTYPFYTHMGAKKIGEKTYTLDGKTRTLPLMQYQLVS